MKLLARLSVLALAALPVSLAAATITGTVTDRTTNKPAAGDTAVLLDLSQGMQESARTTIDAQGHFSFTVASTAGMHLVRVEHQKADYYGPVPPNSSTVNIDVYDVAPKVQGVHIYADVVRMQTDSQALNVTENYFVRNESKPPLTQFGDQAFVFSLPAGAVVQGGEATGSGPAAMPVTASPVPLKQKNQYAFVFPLRPGETEFQVAYSLPYSGSMAFHPAVSMPTDNLAVMIPTSMSFSGGSTFQSLKGQADEPGTQTFLANNVDPGTTLAFTVSGTGSMPREAQNGQGENGQGDNGQGSGQAMGQGGQDQSAQSGAPGGGLAPPIDTPDPLQKYKWWILSGVGLALVIVAGFMLRARPGLQPAGGAPGPPEPSALTPTVPAGMKATALRAELAAHAPPPLQRTAVLHPGTPVAPGTAAAGSSMLAALKEELFALETERLEGKLSEAEYAQLKSALEVVMRRALARQATR